MNPAGIERVRSAFETSEPGSGWLRQLREQALQRFTATGFPSRHDEDWKYTSLEPVADRSLRYLSMQRTAAPSSTDVTALIAAVPAIPNALRIVLLNGAVQTSPDALPSGLRLSRLPDIDDLRQPELERRLSSFEQTVAPALAALNTAFLTDLLYIDVAKGCEIDRTVHVISVADGQPAFAQPRILIRLGANSRCRIVEHHVSRGQTVSNTITQIDCDAGSRLEYIKLQDESDEAHHLAAQQVELGPHARLETVHLDLGASLARNDLQVRLKGRSASAALYGLFIADGHRHLDNHTDVEHCVGDTNCKEVYRGIVCDHGRGVFNGRILVHPGADGSNASLENRNLLLDRTAEIDTKPELEIYTDDVKCSHGSTTGQLDATAVFYLRSRGIDEAQARQMLTIAFAREVADRIDISALRETLDRTIERRVGADLSMETADI